MKLKMMPFSYLLLLFVISCSGCDNDTDNNNKMKLLWEKKVQTDLYSFTRPASSGTIVVFGTVTGEIHGFSTENGDLKWQTKIGNSELPRNSFVSFDNQIYYDYFQETYCLNITNGQIVWKYIKPHYSSLSFPDVTDQYVFTGDGKVTQPGEESDGYVYCLNRTNGQLIWKTRIGERVYKLKSSLTDDYIYVCTRDWNFISGGNFGSLYCINKSSGGIVWEFNATLDSLNQFKGGGTEGMPGIHNDRIYITTLYGSIICLNRYTGQKIWHYNAENGFFCGITIDNNNSRLYTVANTDYLCLDFEGNIIWKNKPLAAGSVMNVPTLYSNTIYSFEIGGIRILEPNGGRQLYELSIDDPIEGYVGDIVINNHKLFVHSGERIFAYSTLSR